MFTNIISKLKLNNEKDKSLNIKFNVLKKKVRTLNYNSFTNKQRKWINNGNKKKLLLLKQKNPEKFICSSCKHSISNKFYSSCTLYKITIIDEQQECYSCNNMEV